jgi:hypothetical protein
MSVVDAPAPEYSFATAVTLNEDRTALVLVTETGRFGRLLHRSIVVVPRENVRALISALQQAQGELSTLVQVGGS